MTVNNDVSHHEVLVIGAGFGGINAGVQLRKAGIEDFVILDKWHQVGGTWNANRYPGVAVDIPSFIYQFSYQQKGSWSRLFAEGGEIQKYAEEVVTRQGLRSKLRLETAVERMRFDEATDLWHVETDKGEYTARFVIGGIGGLEVPNLPDIAGIDTFGGKVIHTSRWDHDYDLTGKRVAVIGTGATALQVIPTIAEQVSHLTVFQRTPIWVGPKPDWDTGPVTKAVLGNPLTRWPLRAVGMVGTELGIGGALVAGPAAIPALRGVETAIKLWMRTQVKDKDLRDKLTPDYLFACKRPSISNSYLRTFEQPHVDLITDPIEKITPDAVVTQDGTEHPIDVLICATGFKVMEKGATPPFPTLGRGGVDLNNWWDENRYQAYQGVSVPGFPNFFMVIGPYAYSPGSYLVLIEATGRHAVRVICEARRRRATRAEIKQEPHERYWKQMLRRVGRTPIVGPLCAGSNTYYLNYQGDGAAYRPSTGLEMRLHNRFFPLDNYQYSLARAKFADSIDSEHELAVAK
ncbi:NAD(P)/FAD-dependent oxidoreductase [Nocardia uniformis]|uniref:NAD(P)/FAD-dependent oxidoreductase n=1 Tax=Nocardia uniformis TaxID=53432 RepID=A0A849C221_9NOCA|nr:NAD(P)/FAD-dependent oxidoreductase [Nocardia uniformis]NNH72762.1 NAD(P)/FAD-dependent oxidoreductase [Nocardia uniformis]